MFTTFAHYFCFESTVKQKGRNFETTEDEMKAFLRINFIMVINKLPSMEDYWSTGKCIGKEKIQNQSRT